MASSCLFCGISFALGAGLYDGEGHHFNRGDIGTNTVSCVKASVATFISSLSVEICISYLELFSLYRVTCEFPRTTLNDLNMQPSH